MSRKPDKTFKLPKGNLVFIKDPIIKEFIDYCKENYSDKIEKINLYLNTEHNDWQMIVKEGETGLVWAPWHIPTKTKVIVEGGNLSNIKIDKSKYQVIERGCCDNCGEGYDNEEEWKYNTHCEVCGYPIPDELIIKKKK